MTEILLGAAVGLSVAALGYVAERKKIAARREEETAQAVEECRRGGASILAVEVLKRAEMSLRKQRGAGYGPWMSACLERAQKGLPVDPSVALTAVRWTIRELEWSRFDLTALEAAAGELEWLAG